jgi:hypothetical protein
MGNRDPGSRPETAHYAVLGWLKEASVRAGQLGVVARPWQWPPDIATRYEAREILKLRSLAAAGS